jgi:dTDP-glucose 4,6-dehydratase
LRYLVTGGAGFVGSNLVRHILATDEAAEVRSLDALTYAGNLDGMSDLEADARYRFVHADVCDPEAVLSALEGVDVVLHLAAESHVDRSIVADAPFVRTNVVGTQTLLAAALARGRARIVQVSTDEVYGELAWRDPTSADPDAPKFTEDTPLSPRSPYSATKAAADHLALAYHVTHGLDVVVTRCSNNYGPRQFPEKLIPLAITHVLEDRPVPIYGDGLYVRDWVHVEDHCRGILAAAARGAPGRVYNFGGGAERTNLGVVHAILAAMDRRAHRIEHVADRPGHDRRYAVDFSRAERELEWRPRHRFEEALPATVDWYLENEAWWRRILTGEHASGRRP